MVVLKLPSKTNSDPVFGSSITWHGCAIVGVKELTSRRSQNFSGITFELRCQQSFKRVVTREQPVSYRTETKNVSESDGMMAQGKLRNAVTYQTPKSFTGGSWQPIVRSAFGALNLCIFQTYFGILLGRMRTPENKLVKLIMRPPKPCAVTLSRTRETIIYKEQGHAKKWEAPTHLRSNLQCASYLTKESKSSNVEREEQVVNEKFISRNCEPKHEVENGHEDNAGEENEGDFRNSQCQNKCYMEGSGRGLDST